ncbi:MAG: hypothetical protein GX616_03040 [Planctomycetes bacterium]|nr:hypothetical protein [Planctomycetota bacterium]
MIASSDDFAVTVRIRKMRFKISQTNIEIDPSPEGTPLVVLALAKILVPRWTPKVYFATRKNETYPALEQRSAELSDLRVLDYKDNSAHILDKFRIIEDDDGMLYVADGPGRLTVKDRKQICHHLAELPR